MKMADNTIEAKIAQLGDQITIMTNQLSKQNARLVSLEKAWAGRFGENFAAETSPSVAAPQPAVPADRIQTQSISPAASGAIWAGSGSFLARLATICFILVIAF